MSKIEMKVEEVEREGALEVVLRDLDVVFDPLCGVSAFPSMSFGERGRTAHHVGEEDAVDDAVDDEERNAGRRQEGDLERRNERGEDQSHRRRPAPVRYNHLAVRGSMMYCLAMTSS